MLTANEGRYQLTVANATGVTLNDNNDSDAQVSTISAISAPVISVTTSYLGSVDHSFDVGFYCLPTAVSSVSVTAPTCPASSIVANDDGRIDLTGIQNGNKTFLYTTSIPPAYTATANSQTVVNGSVSYTDLANPTSTSGTSYSIIIYNGPCCYTIVSAVLPQNTCIPALALSVTPGVCQTLTNEYTLTGTISLTNAITDTMILTDGTATTTVSVIVGMTSVPYSLPGLPSGTGLHSLSVSYAGQAISQTYTAPLSCTVAADVAVSNAVVCAGESAVLTASGCELGTITWSVGTTPSSGSSVSVSTLILAGITSPTELNFIATCTIGNSVTTAVASLTVNPKPTLEKITSVCAGPDAYTIILTGELSTTPGSLTYELVRGSSFGAGTPITAGKTPLPANGILVPLQQAGLYWVRVYTETDCYSELSGEVQVCDCLPDKCVPFVIQRIRR
ncbi:hypothetical protein GO730_17460 [Spirosoma sp. HMF3257]|uniref:Uncharacterized protein n=1 Tax=Spirosoma telluris TaxID=2183553 RepID=A0A327NN82_9BACT|nr:hypothetical protein [Spirosoma telluris]RAI75496.1 hypothetical protein HMF3257_17385 [Spirosoma telluris]